MNCFGLERDNIINVKAFVLPSKKKEQKEEIKELIETLSTSKKWFVNTIEWCKCNSNKNNFK